MNPPSTAPPGAAPSTSRARPTTRALAAPVALSCAWLWLYASFSWVSVYLRLGLASAAVLAYVATLGRPRLAGWLRPTAADFGLGAGVGLSLVGLSYGTWELLNWLWPSLTFAGQATYALGTLHRPWLELPLLASVVVAEELLFRGLWLEAWGDTRQAMAGVWAIVAYAVGQVGAGEPLVVGLALALGTVWTVLTLWRQNLWPALLSHGLWLGAMLAHPPFSTPTPLVG